MSESVAEWSNWVGNRRCTPARRRVPTTVDEVCDAVRSAHASRLPVRVAASGHSYTDICTTPGMLLEMRDFAGITQVDATARRVTMNAGTRIEQIGDPLWAAGLSLHNQGDIEAQQIAGATSTGTHGSGLTLRNMSSSVQSMELVTADGSRLLIDESNPDLLAAARISVGMLGVITSLTLDVAPAFKISEVVEHWSYRELMARWDEAFATHRHFSMFWCPTSTAHDLYDLECPADLDMADVARVKICDPVPLDTPDDMAAIGSRIGRPYRIYPQFCAPNLHELEYMLPFECGTEAFDAVRRIVLDDPEFGIFPVEVRSTAGDDAMLSPNYGGDSLVISVSGQPGRDYEPFLRRIHAALAEFGARPHWGKLHYFTREELDRVLPRHDDFVRLRRQFDPDGVFLNDSLRPLFV
jgi:FAD/FMN-containing dehydrogenase